MERKILLNKTSLGKVAFFYFKNLAIHFEKIINFMSFDINAAMRYTNFPHRKPQQEYER